MKRFTKHEKITIALTIVSLLLMSISFLEGGPEEATGILQGISTGLISGITLLFVTGIKTKDYRVITAKFNALFAVNESLHSITRAYDYYFHTTYRGRIKKMQDEQILILQNMLIKGCKDGFYKLIENIKNYSNNEIDSNIKTDIDQFIEDNIEFVNSFDGKKVIKDIQDEYSDFSNQAFILSLSTSKALTSINKKKEQLENSLI